MAPVLRLRNAKNRTCRLVYRVARKIKVHFRERIKRAKSVSPLWCDHCRVYDSADQRIHVARALVRAAEKTEFELLQIPGGYEDLRFGFFCEIGRETDNFLDEVGKQGVAFQRKTLKGVPNEYEFRPDQMQTDLPRHYYRMYPKPTCRHSTKYLRRQAVSLEPLVACGDDVLISRSGVGPRAVPASNLTRARGDRLPTTFAIADCVPPIDAVYTWVDDTDPEWQKRLARYKAQANHLGEAPRLATHPARWENFDELKYSLRSIHMYMPWVRNIFVVTDGQHPEWLVDGAGVTVVSHKEILGNEALLPTFNSHVIESGLSNIPGLSERFVYLNDDFFIARPLSVEAFFTGGGLTKHFPSNRFVSPLAPNGMDRATVKAHKNSKVLLEQKLNIEVGPKLKHAPYAMRKSVWQMFENRFSSELNRLRKERFRSSRDITPVSLMYEYFSSANGYGYFSDIKSAYVDISSLDFEQKINKLHTLDTDVFCINHAGSSDPVSAERKKSLSEFLEARFPIVPPWECPSVFFRQQDGTFESINQWSISSRSEEVSIFGPNRYTNALSQLREIRDSPILALKLADHHFARGELEQALVVLNSSQLDARRKALRVAAYKSKSGFSVDALVAELPPDLAANPPVALLRHLLRAVDSPESFAAFRKVLTSAPRTQEVILLEVAGMRRSGGSSRAISLLEQCLIMSTRQAVSAKPISKGKRRWSITDAGHAFDDMLEMASDLGIKLFADAGTLLGLVRDGTFIPHDYDLDFGIRAVDGGKSLAALREASWRDWRFEVVRGRSPETVLQLRHWSGILIDVLMHQMTERGTWEKRSHVYSWEFADYELEQRVAGDRRFWSPADAKNYLRQMYGPNWRVPDPGFDSRLFAPNLTFPDASEAVCTIVAKAIADLSFGDVGSARTKCEYLAERLDYEVPKPVRRFFASESNLQ